MHTANVVICLLKPIQFAIEEPTHPIWKLKTLVCKDDLSEVFNAGETMGIGPTTLAKIIEHLEQIYCDSIGVEYMYIRDPEKVNWIQQRSQHQ